MEPLATSLIEDFDLTSALDCLAVAIFAFAGGHAVGRKRLNVPGTVLVAAVAGVSGAAGRDLAMRAIPATWLSRPFRLISRLAAAGIALIRARIARSLDRPVLRMDALGLFLFCALGTRVALETGFPMIPETPRGRRWYRAVEGHC